MMRPVFFLLLLLGFAAPSRAGFEEGRKAYNEKDWVQAIFHLRPAAENGDENAMIILGNMYLNGLGVAKDPQQAFVLYRKAAVRHSPDAMVMVAALYQKGIGVRKNLRYAAEWYGRAGRLGHGTGAFFHAIHMFRGNKTTVGGIPQPEADFAPDHESAYKWFRIAEKSSHNSKLAQTAHKLAANVATRLSAERLAALNAEIAAWSPEMPDMLGPLPEETPASAKPAPEEKPEGTAEKKEPPPPEDKTQAQ